MTDASADTKAARFKEAASEHDQRVGAWHSQMVGLLASRDLGGTSERQQRVRNHFSEMRESGYTIMQDLASAARPAPAPADLVARCAKAIKERDAAREDRRKVHSSLIAAVNNLYGFGFVSGSPIDGLLDDLVRVTKSLRGKVEERDGEIKRLDAELVLARDLATSAPVAVQVPEEWVAWARRTVDADGATGKGFPSIHEDTDIAQSILAASASEPAPEPDLSSIAPPEPISDEDKARVVESADGQRQRESKPSAGLLQAAVNVASNAGDAADSLGNIHIVGASMIANLRQAIAAEEERGAENVQCDRCHDWEIDYGKLRKERDQLRKELEATKKRESDGVELFDKLVADLRKELAASKAETQNALSLMRAKEAETAMATRRAEKAEASGDAKDAEIALLRLKVSKVSEAIR